MKDADVINLERASKLASVGFAAEPPRMFPKPGYEKLADVLRAAHDQAAYGKGDERHAVADVAFEDQSTALLNRAIGSVDGYIFQASKKAIESKRLKTSAATTEMLGAIVYLAGAIIERQREERERESA
jgi:hypothetical protein